MNPPRLFAYALLLLALAAGGARAECLDGRPLRGVNFAGAEFNARTLPGIRDRNYTFPRRTDIEYFAQRGITAVRLPVLWGRLQPARAFEQERQRRLGPDCAASRTSICRGNRRRNAFLSGRGGRRG